MKNKVLLVASLLSTTMLSSCWLFGGSHVSTPDSEKYLSEFHEQYFGTEVDAIKSNSLVLYVDYSTCISMGQSSEFFKELLPSFSNAAKDYYSIEGNNFVRHDADSTYNLLRTINNVDYADLKGAVNKMAVGDSESLLLTDGEYWRK